MFCFSFCKKKKQLKTIIATNEIRSTMNYYNFFDRISNVWLASSLRQSAADRTHCLSGILVKRFVVKTRGEESHSQKHGKNLLTLWKRKKNNVEIETLQFSNQISRSTIAIIFVWVKLVSNQTECERDVNKQVHKHTRATEWAGYDSVMKILFKINSDWNKLIVFRTKIIILHSIKSIDFWL